MTETRDGRRAVVARRRADALARLEHLEDELDAIVETALALPPDDEHDVEGSSVGFERARVSALLESERLTVAALDDALDRLEAGTYGTCDGCGTSIPPERLDALPATTTCVRCASR